MPDRCCFVADHRRSDGVLVCVCGQTWGAAVHHRTPRRPLVPAPRKPGEGTRCPLPIGLTQGPY